MREITLKELRGVFAKAAKDGKHILVDGEIYHYEGQKGHECLYRDNESCCLPLSDKSMVNERKAYIENGILLLRGLWNYDADYSSAHYTDEGAWDELYDEKVKILDISPID